MNMPKSVRQLWMTCEFCNRPWLWDWPYRSKKPSLPKYCPKCRAKLVALLGDIAAPLLQGQQAGGREG
jgi:hypothetical protein